MADTPSSLDFDSASQHCRLLADSTRLRLLLLLEQEELSVAELSAITQLAQPRVSTHLSKLKDAGLVVDRKQGVSVYSRMASDFPDPSLAEMWNILRHSRHDPLAQQDRDRIRHVLRERSGDTWADSVAGDMERHYSPGRTWEATSRALVQLLDLGDVLDIASGDGVMAELLAPQARSITCIDLSGKVVEAGRRRLSAANNVTFVTGDMHELPLPDARYDTVLLLHALTYTGKPIQVLGEAARVLRPGGRLLVMTLERHRHRKAVEPYNHLNQGFTAKQLHDYAIDCGLQVRRCEVTGSERRAPHFRVLTLAASR